MNTLKIYTVHDQLKLIPSSTCLDERVASFCMPSSLMSNQVPMHPTQGYIFSSNQ